MPADEIQDRVPSADDGVDADLHDTAADEADASERRSATLRTIAAAIVLIIVVILVLLMLKTCSTARKAGALGEKTIVPVPTAVRSENVVSVWVKPNGSVAGVMASAGVRPTSTRPMGDGLYFVFLPEGEDAAVVVETLKRDSRVYDAGYVYDDLKVTSP